MKVVSKILCNFCLNLVQDKWHQIDEIMVKTFQVFLLELGFTITKNLFICQECIEDARMCVTFKCSIVEAQIRIASMSCMEENVKHSMRQIFEDYSNKHKIVGEQDSNILCRFCLVFVSVDEAISLDNPMVLKVFSEVDIDTIEDPVLCVDCWNGFQAYLKFTTSLLRIKARSKTTTFRYNALCACKCDMTYGPCQHMLVPKKVHEMHHCKKCPFTSKHPQSLSRHNRFVHGDAPRSFQCPICSLKFTKNDTLKQHTVIHRELVEHAKHECDKCSYRTNRKWHMKRHMLAHQKIQDNAMYQCEQCSYKTKRSDRLKKHMIVHQEVAESDMYQCEKCSFKTKRKDTIRGHMVVHQEVEGITDMYGYECDICPFKAKRKGNLKDHMLVHQEVAEKAMYKCDKCSYKTKRKNCLERHKLSKKCH